MTEERQLWLKRCRACGKYELARQNQRCVGPGELDPEDWNEEEVFVPAADFDKVNTRAEALAILAEANNNTMEVWEAEAKRVRGDLDKALAALREAEKVVEAARLVVRSGGATGPLNNLGRVVKALDGLREPA